MAANGSVIGRFRRERFGDEMEGIEAEGRPW